MLTMQTIATEIFFKTLIVSTQFEQRNLEDCPQSLVGMGIENRFYQGPGSTFFKTRKSITFGLIDNTIESRWFIFLP